MISFWNANGDTGNADTASVQPITDGENVNATISGRPSENLRLRTEVLHQAVSGAELAQALKSLTYSVTDSGGDNTVSLNWDGSYDPINVASANPTQGTASSGRFWLAGTSGPSLVLTTPAYAATAVAANATVTLTGNGTGAGSSVAITLNSTLAALFGANYTRVRVFTSLTSELGVGVKATAAMGFANAAVHFTAPSAPGTSYPIAPPANATGDLSTLTIQVRADGTSTLGDIATAIATLAGGQTVPFSLHYATGQSSATAIPATSTTAFDSGYVTLAGGLDSLHWTLAAADLAAFFNSGAVQTTLTAAVAIGLNSVAVAATTNISVGMSVTVGDPATPSARETVVVTAVNTGASTITANFTKTHNIADVVSALPNALAAGDVLVAKVGKLSAPAGWKVGALTSTDLAKVSRGTVSAADMLIPIAVVNTSATTPGLFVNSWYVTSGTAVKPLAAATNTAASVSYAGGGAWKDGTTNPATTVEAQLDKVISDLAGTAGAAKIGSAATGNIASTNIQAALAELDAEKAIVDGSGVVHANGLTRDTAGTVSVGTGANDSAVTVGKTGATTTVAGALTVAQALVASTGATITTGGLTVSAGATNLNGGATIASGATVSSGNLAISSGTITASGQIKSTSGGIGFPDNSVQPVAAQVRTSYAFSPAASVTVTSSSYIRNGAGTVTLLLKLTIGAIFSPGDTIGSLDAAAKPLIDGVMTPMVFNHTGTNAAGFVMLNNTSGVVQTFTNLASGDVVHVSTTFAGA